MKIYIYGCKIWQDYVFSVIHASLQQRRADARDASRLPGICSSQAAFTHSLRRWKNYISQTSEKQ